MGVHWERNRWRARYYWKGKQYSVGTYGTRLAAVRALNKAKKQNIELEKYPLPYELINHVDEPKRKVRLTTRLKRYKNKVLKRVKKW